MDKNKIALLSASLLSSFPAAGQAQQSNAGMLAADLTAQSSISSSPSAGAPAATGETRSASQFLGLEEIVVTAQRRSENLQNVPIAVSAVGAAQLAKSGVDDVLDLRLAVPTLNITNSNNELSTSLRGLGSTGVAPGFENPIAIYVDGVYYASQAATFLGFNNISQIEVLKGPQGTLFGRNATGGLIQVTTRTPGQEFVAEGEIGYANYDTVNGQFYIAGPISDTVAADIAVRAVHQGDGWGRNLANGKDVYKVDHDFGIRSKLVFSPSETTSFTIIGDYSDSKDSLSPFAIQPGTFSGFPVLPGSPAPGRAPDLGYDVNNDTQPYKRGWAAGGSLKWDQKIGDIDLVSTTAYRESKYSAAFDYDGTARLPSSRINYNWPDRQFSQELQLSSKSGGKLSWVAGAYYFRATSAYDPVNLLFDDLGAHISVTNHQRTTSLAGYGQGTYEIFDRTNLTLGVRYTTEKREVYDDSTTVYVVPLDMTLPPTDAQDRKKTFNKLTFRVSLDHRFSDEVLGYVSFNRGFKSGGFNTGSPGTDPYRPETIDAYEAGLKTDLFDRRLRVNVAGFYYDYGDVQSQQLASGVIQIVNAAAARIYGMDLDFQARVTDALRFSGGFGLTSAKYTSYPAALISVPEGGSPSEIGSAKGNQLPLASKFSGNLSANYTHPLSSGSLDLNASLYYNSGFFLEADNRIRQPDFVQIGASAKWESEGGRFSLGIFGKNLTNERILTFGTTVVNGTHAVLYAPPRTYGVTAGFKF